MADLDEQIELQVRLTLTNDVQTDAIIFPLPSHRNDSPVDTLAGFLNQRRGEFFLVRMQDGSQMLLPLCHCLMFDLTHQVEEMMCAINPNIRDTRLTSDPKSVVSFSPVVLTLATSRIVRGDMWFFEFDPEEERNVIAALNRNVRFVCIHGERATHFVRREGILKVQLQGDKMRGSEGTSHPSHVTETSGLIDVGRFRDDTVQPVMMPRGTTARPAPLTHESAIPAPPPVPPGARPATPPNVSSAPQEFPFMPGSASRVVRKPGLSPPAATPPPEPPQPEKNEEEGPQGIDERFWY